MSPGSHFVSMVCITSPVSPGGQHTSTSCISSHSGCSGSPISLGIHYMNHIKINPFSDVLCPQWALEATSYQCHIPSYSRSMHYVSSLSPESHQDSTPVTFSYSGRSRSPVSHRSHYMNHVKIYPFSYSLCPRWAIGATLYQCHVLTAQCVMCPHWAPGPSYFIILYI